MSITWKLLNTIKYHLNKENFHDILKQVGDITSIKPYDISKFTYTNEDTFITNEDETFAHAKARLFELLKPFIESDKQIQRDIDTVISEASSYTRDDVFNKLIFYEGNVFNTTFSFIKPSIVGITGEDGTYISIGTIYFNSKIPKHRAIITQEDKIWELFKNINNDNVETTLDQICELLSIEIPIWIGDMKYTRSELCKPDDFLLTRKILLYKFKPNINSDIELVMNQTDESYDKACTALIEQHGDIVNAIMALTI